MAWQDILVFADATAAGATRVRLAADLADDHRAHTTVCLPILLPSFGIYGDQLLNRQEFETFTTHQRRVTLDSAEKLRAEFATRGGHITIETPEDLSEDFPKKAAAMAQTFDLVVMGQPTGGLSSRLQHAMLEGVLFGAGRPLLMLPQWKEPRAFGRRVLVGWKNVREAARAVHDALPLLRRADAVRVFASDDVSHGRAANAAYLSRICEHLKRHGVPIAPNDQSPSMREIGLVEEAHVWGADMIAMGGFGHASFQEFVFGGATQDAIQRSPVPVLLSH
jgi:nucleotide-binding universal stress UspA family protein